MSKWNKTKYTAVRPISTTVASRIKLFSKERRNVIRGIVADARRGILHSEMINAIRRNATEQDMLAAANILESPGGLRARRATQLLQSEITAPHKLIAQSAVSEAVYACAFLNAWKKDALVAIDTVALLSRMTEVPTWDALGALRATAQTFGASNYLVLKLAYLKEFAELSDEDKSALAQIDALLGHDRNPLMQYMALENLKPSLSIFSIARRHTNILIDYIEGDLRRFHNLNNLLATPINEDDCAGFLLRGVETSLMDTVRCIWTIANLEDRFSNVYAAIERTLDPDLLASFNKCRRTIAAAVPDLLSTPKDNPDEIMAGHDDYRSLSLYRRSSAFLEIPALCIYRNDIDRVVGHRLLAPLLPNVTDWPGESFSSLEILKQPNGRFEIGEHGCPQVTIDVFYRTYLFLRFIQDPRQLGRMTSQDIISLFDNTMNLDALLLESELKTMHLNASDETRALISVLALSLYRSKSSDPDIDFDFRSNLESYIIENFGGRIPDFIDSLAPSSPEVANYIASSLDEVTLQKMYQLIPSSLAAENARREILTIVGVHLNNLDYIIEAEAIETRSKVAKLKNYFDTSRMFVDSIAMRKWLSANPSTYTEQYKEFLPKITARVGATKPVMMPSGKEAQIGIVELGATDEYLVERIATDAFREFCANNEFGIESYLGRRIRHNTLHGVMTKSVDSVIQSEEFHPVIAGTPFGAALHSWESSYKIFIERMRKEFLQFRSDSMPNALFNSILDPIDAATRRNLQQLVMTLRASGPEMLNELIISFCWRQIAPQLESASRQIRVNMSQQVIQQLDYALRGFNGPEELKVKALLENGISAVFAQVASWFQVPQTGFVPASVPEICNIIDIEHGRSSSPTIVAGDRQSTKYYGISVHRLYDCLAVLLQNAFKHGALDADVFVTMSSTPIADTNLDLLDVTVRSILPEKNKSECIRRVAEALTSSETGEDMVTEGYSGIKKVKFITRLNEGAPTATFAVTDNAIDVRFQLKVELADEEKDH